MVSSIKKKEIYDVLFIGDLITPLNKNRLELVKVLSRDYKIALATSRDPQLPNIQYIGSTFDPRKLNVWLNQARLVVGSDRLADTQTLNNLPGQSIFYDDEFFIRQRAYVVLGSGSCYLVERHPEIERKFKDGEEIVLWDDYEDLINKTGNLLKDSNKRQSISLHAHARALAEHSTPVRCNQLLQLLDMAESL